MTTDASAVPPVLEFTQEQPRRPGMDADEAVLLDIAAALALTRSDAEKVVLGAIDSIVAAHSGQIDSQGKATRARLSGEVGALADEIARRTRMSEDLVVQRERRAALRDKRGGFESAIAMLEGELIQRRHAAEDAQLAGQIAQMRADEADAQRRAANFVPASSLGPEETARQREAAVLLLTEKRERVSAEVKPALEREEALAKKSVTQTVAGFLLWLGYGSVAATGAVLALVMNEGDGWQVGAMMEGWRAIVEAIPIPWAPGRLLAGVGLVWVLLWLLRKTIVASDALLRKRRDWMRDERRAQEPVNLTPQSITRKTYTQFIALLPVLFGAGMIFTILALSPARAASGNDGNMLTSMLPMLGYAFVGIVIAFLSTAVFVMYVIRVVEPRGTKRDDRSGVLLTAWEFAIPPLVLVIAVACTPLLLPKASLVWIPWAGFMLLSSLALAHGVVYHGVFKDAKTARGRLIKLDEQLERERGFLMYGAPGPDENISREYDGEVWRIRKTMLELQSRRLGIAISARPADHAKPGRLWNWIRAPRAALAASEPSVGYGFASGAYRAIDYEVAADLIAQLAVVRSRRADAAAELTSLDDSIRELETLTSFETICDLVRRHEDLKGDGEASKAEDEEWKYRAGVMAAMLKLQAQTAVANGTSVKPFFEGVRSDLARRVPYVVIPAPASGDQS